MVGTELFRKSWFRASAACCCAMVLMVGVAGCPILFPPAVAPCDVADVCDDGDACTQNLCTEVEGEAVCDNPPKCDDDDPCTDDTCDAETAECTNEAKVCDDLDNCTVDACVQEGDDAGTCVSVGKTCPEAEACDGETGECAPVCEGRNCDDEDDCTTDSCTDGVCDNADIEGCCNADEDCGDGEICVNNACETVCVEDAECDDGQPCNGEETCADGICADGTPIVCDDGNDCTVDACVQEGDDAGTCINVDITCPNEGDVCVDGVCGPIECTEDVDCDDEDDCTTDTCTDGACGHEAIDGCCNADEDCAEGETCVANECTGACEEDADCDDENLCTTDTCVEGACINLDVDCDDGDACTVNACDLDTGDCAPPAPLCDDEDDCTVDSCDAGECTNDPVDCPFGQTCVDGNCEDIECVDSADCDDGLACTVDVCVSGACSFSNIDDLCDDGNFCTGDGTCDPTDEDSDADGCVFTGDPCGGNDPVCNEATNECEGCEDDADCDDGFVCTIDSCDTGTGACDNDPQDVNCPDALFCDGEDACLPNDPDADADGCVAPGTPCTGGTPVCDEDTDTCAPCVGNPDCDDGLACTLDTCDGKSGECTSAPDDALCPNGDFCNGVDTCDPTDPDADDDGCVPSFESPCLHCTGGAHDTESCVVADDCNGCVGGQLDGEACGADANCDVCFGGTNDGTECTDGGGECTGGGTCDFGNTCENGNTCDGPQACDLSDDSCFACTSNEHCDDGIGCTDNTCDGGTGFCNTPVDLCTGGDVCNMFTGECETP